MLWIAKKLLALLELVLKHTKEQELTEEEKKDIAEIRRLTKILKINS